MLVVEYTPLSLSLTISNYIAKFSFAFNIYCETDCLFMNNASCFMIENYYEQWRHCVPVELDR